MSPKAERCRKNARRSRPPQRPRNENTHGTQRRGVTRRFGRPPAHPMAVRRMQERISDEEAVNRVKEGDPDSYAILVNRHQARLQRLARRLLRNDADAEDAVQNAHLLA
ncbi:MAG: hypothetical protein LAQ30_09135, partial [Acidobacteriia bacterium]|nr:hypothetical protein [Terriglobia bacterium]